jgi:hypothetical protein
MYRKRSRKGELVSWSFFVNGPERMSKRCEPELTIAMNGFGRVLFIRITVGVA